MEARYEILWHHSRWVIKRTCWNDSHRFSDYYQGIDAPWGPYCFGANFISSAKGFRWRWQASRALKKYVAYTSNVRSELRLKEENDA